MRTRRRAFVLAHHPDRGGDPIAFVQGLADLAAQQSTAPTPGRRIPVVVVAHRSWPKRVAEAALRLRRPTVEPRVR